MKGHRTFPVDSGRARPVPPLSSRAQEERLERTQKRRIHERRAKRADDSPCLIGAQRPREVSDDCSSRVGRWRSKRIKGSVLSLEEHAIATLQAQGPSSSEPGGAGPSETRQTSTRGQHAIESRERACTERKRRLFEVWPG